jgi:hypothetical protein
MFYAFIVFRHGGNFRPHVILHYIGQEVIDFMLSSIEKIHHRCVDRPTIEDMRDCME